VMDTPVALGRLGVAALTTDQRESFETQGFFVVPNVLTGEECAAIAAEFDRLTAAESDATGAEVAQEVGATRLSNLFNKSAAFDPCLRIGPAMAAAASLLGDIKLHGANMREPAQGFGQQPLHSDVPKPGPNDWRLTNTLITIDPVTVDNGPTRVVPGSHHWPYLNVPAENLLPDEPATGSGPGEEHVPADGRADYPGQILLTAPPGTAVVINGHIWHGGTANRSGARRRLVHISYVRRDLDQQFDQRGALTPELYERLDPALRFMLDVEREAQPA
jgi:ectoine hydroxylase-related dioxygenase (phytanoyl-CoA dioxygenase family)